MRLIKLKVALYAATLVFAAVLQRKAITPEKEEWIRDYYERLLLEKLAGIP